MNVTMLSILEKRKEDLRVAKALEEKKQSWMRRTRYTDSTDEVDSLDEIHWWPGVIYKDHGELILDVK